MIDCKLNIHADRSALFPGQPHVAMLYPFWGKSPEAPGFPDTGRFDDYSARGSELFNQTSLDQADVAVLAGDWIAGGGTPQAHAFCEKARKAGKPILIFFNNDADEDISIDGAIVFRTSAQRSQRRPNVFGLPAWSEDFVNIHRNGEPPIRSKQIKPVVGYCGYGMNSVFLPPGACHVLCQYPVISRIINSHRGVAANLLRSMIIGYLSRSPSVLTNFLLRSRFWNGAIVNGVLDQKCARQSRVEYVNNMFNSDYILCTRGVGNFSFRFYEALCSGRIPLFVDTDCLLPHDSWINWREHCVWVDKADAAHVSQRLAAFHAALSPAAFEEKQHACRRLWREWLSPTGFFSQIHRYLK